MFLQHCSTQQGYFPAQVPNCWVSPESTQGGLRLWSWVETTSFPLPHHRVLSGSQGGRLEKFVVKQSTQSSREKALYKCRPTKIKSLACPRSEHNIHLQEAYLGCILWSNSRGIPYIPELCCRTQQKYPTLCHHKRERKELQCNVPLSALQLIYIRISYVGIP